MKLEDEKTQVINDEDDIDYSALKKTPEKKEEELEEKSEEEKAEEGKEEEAPQIEAKKEEGKEEDEKPANEEKEEEVEEDEDIFKEAEDSSSEEKAETAFDFSSFAKEFEIEGSEEVKDKESFKKAFEKRLEDARQEVDLSKFSDQAKKLINHLNDGKTNLETFFENPLITSMNRMLSLTPEERFREVRYNEILKDNKNDEDKTIELLEEELESMSKGEIKTAGEEIAEQAKKIRQEELSKIIDAGDKRQADLQEEQKILKQKEKENVLNFIDKQDSFFGLTLTKDAKATIQRDIDNGKFDEIVGKSPEATKFFAYMVGKYGNKIIQRYENVAKEANREGHNQAQDKSFNALHKTKPVSGKTAGHQSQNEGKRNFDRLDESVFGEQG